MLVALPSHRPRRAASALALALLAACGSASSTSPREDAAGAGAPPATTPAGGAAADAGGALDATLPGVWEVRGADERGAYEGHVELVPQGDGLAFTRVIRYLGVTVEDGRALSWVWRGKAKGTLSSLHVDVTLRRRHFVRRRGQLERSPTDADVAVAGTLSLAGGEMKGTFAGEGVSATETWSARTPSGPTPLFVSERAFVPAHDPPDPATRQNLFSLYASYHALPAIAPYVSRPEFLAAVHRHIVDRTDFDFYRANPNALRVVDKVVDPISLQETLARANAFRFTLAEKAIRYDADMKAKFLLADMVADGRAGGVLRPSVDSALWTATYIASQVYRFEVTGEPEAKLNAAKSLDALLRLQEITGDWSSFARVLRPATGTPSPPWHAGTGAHAGLEWREGGNNDMLKGLLYGYVVGHRLLCAGPGHEALCGRLRANAGHLADDVRTTQGLNDIATNWLAALVTGSLERRVKAEGVWSLGKEAMAKTPLVYYQGTCDWSGVHLGWIGSLVHVNLSSAMPLAGGSSTGEVLAVLKDNYEAVARQHLGYMDAAYVALVDPTAAGARDQALWRLREMPYPKMSWEVDHRLDPDFVMSPYPSLPWKNDFLEGGRTQSLDTFPLFEAQADVVIWKTGMNDYDDHTEGYEKSPSDYLHLYWFARRYGVLSASD